MPFSFPFAFALLRSNVQESDPFATPTEDATGLAENSNQTAPGDHSFEEIDPFADPPADTGPLPAPTIAEDMNQETQDPFVDPTETIELASESSTSERSSIQEPQDPFADPPQESQPPQDPFADPVET